MNQLDVHIVAPHSGIYFAKSFSTGNVHFHFFPYRVRGIPMRIISNIHYLSDFIFFKRVINKIVKKINPDLIHVFGTENAYFASSIFQFNNKYPILITIQGFVSCLKDNDFFSRKRKKVEKKIIRSFKYFGTRDEMMNKFLLNINPDAVFYNHEIIPYIPKIRLKEKKSFDLAFFARISKEKGVEDFIEVVSLLSAEYKSIKAFIIGESSDEYSKFLKNLIWNYGVENNIEFIGKLNTIDEVHALVARSKVTVLPTYFDTIPGTILESMMMKIPCISYAVGGIPSLNENFEIIKLVEKGDVIGLANQIRFLLENEEFASEMAEKAYNYVSERWNTINIYNSILYAYNDLLGKKLN
ncbi:MAG: glycosyltransferase family 4 protein [Bacteroidales bacterium]|nr:glycosyltransferase family 4 protein [Bacteroidales bacterium]